MDDDVVSPVMHGGDEASDSLLRWLATGKVTGAKLKWRLKIFASGPVRLGVMVEMPVNAV